MYTFIRVVYAQRKERAFTASKNGRMTDGQRRNQTHFDFCVKQRTRRTWYVRYVNSSVGIHVSDCYVHASNGRMTRVPSTSNAQDVRGTYAVKLDLNFREVYGKAEYRGVKASSIRCACGTFISL
jgi:hypothetical protein